MRTVMRVITALLAASAASAFAASIEVRTATYGSNCRAGLEGNITAHVRAACNGREVCPYALDHKTVGDPAVGCAKTATIQYGCSGTAKVRAATLSAEASGQAVTLSCAAGAAVAHFPIRVRGDASFKDGGGADWVVDGQISDNGRLDVGSNIKAHRSINGWCGRVQIFVYDEGKNVVGQYGMGDDHSWCVNGRLSPAGGSERNDRITQTIPASVLNRIAYVSVMQVSSPTPKITAEQAWSAAKSVIQAAAAAAAK